MQRARSMITLVTGGARSGKSQYALDLAERFARRAFIATAEPIDDELRERIRQHRQERGTAYTNLEEPVDLAAALRRIPAGTEVAVVDCLTIWLGNLVHRRGDELCGDPREYPEIVAFLAALATPPCRLVVVTNEVGLGIIPANALARSFAELAGRLNQQLAARAEHVVLMVSGLPLALKGDPE